MQQILSQFSHKYTLTRDEIRSAIEELLSERLSHLHNKEVAAVFQGNVLEAVSWARENGVLRQNSIDLTTMRGKTLSNGN